MRIEDLDQRHEATFCLCLEDWSDEMAEAGDHKRRWLEKMRDRGLRVKLAIDDSESAVGMIQYLPIEQSFAIGRDLYMILCIWVHGHEEGIGNHQGHGIGSSLLGAAEEDARSLGAKGIAAWGLTMPFWMAASWFKKHGYQHVATQEGSELVWKPFSDDAQPPAWIEPGRPPRAVEGQVTVTAYLNGWCPSANVVYERARRAAEDAGPRVAFESIDTSEPPAMVHHGQTDAIFIDGKALRTGPPPSLQAIEKKLKKRLRRLDR